MFLCTCFCFLHVSLHVAFLFIQYPLLLSIAMSVLCVIYRNTNNMQEKINCFFFMSLYWSKRTIPKSFSIDLPSHLHWPEANTKLVSGKVPGTISNCVNYQNVSKSHLGGLDFSEKWDFAFKEEKYNGNSV